MEITCVTEFHHRHIRNRPIILHGKSVCTKTISHPLLRINTNAVMFCSKRRYLLKYLYKIEKREIEEENGKFGTICIDTYHLLFYRGRSTEC